VFLVVQGVIKLIDAAKKGGVKKFVLQTSILTNGKAIGEGFNPIFLVLNAITGALDKKLEVLSFCICLTSTAVLEALSFTLDRCCCVLTVRRKTDSP
jgi:hypothetical protein